MARGCREAGRLALTSLFPFLIDVIVITYKTHTFCLVEEFDEMAPNHPIKENLNIN